MLSPRLIVTPATLKSAVAWRALTWTGGSKRSSSSTALAVRSGRLAEQGPLFGMAGERDEGVAERSGDGLVAGEEQEPDHPDDLVVVQRGAVVGGGERGDQVIAGFAATLSDHVPEVGVQLGEALAHRCRVERGQRLQHPADLP